MSESTPEDDAVMREGTGAEAGDGAAADLTGLPEGYPLNQEYEVTPAGLAGVMGGERGAAVPDEADKPLLLDVRNPDEVDAARIHDDATVIRLQELEDRVEELVPHQDRRIIVHCRLGQRSLLRHRVPPEQGLRRLEHGRRHRGVRASLRRHEAGRLKPRTAGEIRRPARRSADPPPGDARRVALRLPAGGPAPGQ